MKTVQVTEIISIVKKYLVVSKVGTSITLRVNEADLNAVKMEIEGVLEPFAEKVHQKR